MRHVLLGGGALLAALAAPASAQLSSASAAALGLGENYGASARGFNAVAWNPANLGLPDNPRFSLSLLGVVRGSGGIGPIGPGDAAEYNGLLVPDQVRDEWLTRIRAEGGQHGAFGADATWLALSVRRFALQLTTRFDGVANLPADAAELALFGNAGRTGEPRDFDLAGTRFDGAASTTAAIAYAHPVALRIGSAPDQRFSVGATLKYTVGHLMAQGRDAGSVLGADPIRFDVRMPTVTVNDSLATDGEYDFGRGVGLDLGAAWQGGRWSAGVALRNVVSTFRWDESRLVYSPGATFFATDSSHSDYEQRAYAQAPADLRARVANYAYGPAVSVAGALRMDARTRVSVDLRHRFGDGVPTDPSTHAGAGIEFRPVGFLPLRAGGALLTGGWQAGGGLGIEAGAVNLTASVVHRNSETYGAGPIAMLGLTFGTR